MRRRGRDAEMMEDKMRQIKGDETNKRRKIRRGEDEEEGRKG